MSESHVAASPRRAVRLDGSRLRKARIAAGVTLRNLANKAGISATSIRRAERGEPVSASTAQALLAALGIRGEGDFLVHFFSHGAALDQRTEAGFFNRQHLPLLYLDSNAKQYFNALKTVGGSVEEALNEAADTLLEVAQHAAEAAIRRGDAIDETLNQIRMVLAEPTRNRVDSDQ